MRVKRESFSGYLPVHVEIQIQRVDAGETVIIHLGEWKPSSQSPSLAIPIPFNVTHRGGAHQYCSQIMLPGNKWQWLASENQ